MRVVLINPPLDAVLARGEITPVTSYLFHNSAPLGLLYLAAMLEQAHHSVLVIDAAAERLNVRQTVLRVQRFRPDVVGITSTTVGFDDARALAAECKRAMPQIPIVLGGPHCSLLPEEAMTDTAFDYGFVGEAEDAILEICDMVAGKRPVDSVPGLVHRTDHGIAFNRPRPEIENLDRLPFPARHLLSPHLYRPVPIDQHGLPKFSIISSRGCPHACVYCQKTRSGYRSFSTGYIVDEMEMLVDSFGAKDIAFVDSLFARSHERVEALCDEILARPGLKERVSWTCSARIGCVDKPLLAKMKQAGCWRVRFGLESGNDEVLRFIRKGTTKKEIAQVIRWADEVGLRPKAFFMIGHLKDTRESIEETIAFAKSIPLMDITVQINTILPKTPQETIWKREGSRYGRIVSDRAGDKSFWQPTFVPHGMSADDLVRYHRRFYREFYLRPETLWRHLKAIESLSDVTKYLKAAHLSLFLIMPPRTSTAREQEGGT